MLWTHTNKQFIIYEVFSLSVHSWMWHMVCLHSRQPKTTTLTTARIVIAESFPLGLVRTAFLDNRADLPKLKNFVTQPDLWMDPTHVNLCLIIGLPKLRSHITLVEF